MGLSEEAELLEEILEEEKAADAKRMTWTPRPPCLAFSQEQASCPVRAAWEWPRRMVAGALGCRGRRVRA
jgi:hypothetical protein